MKEIFKDQCVVTNLDSKEMLYTMDLSNDIVISFVSIQLNLAIFARCPTKDTLKEIFDNIDLNNSEITNIKVMIVGGDDSPESKDNVKELFQILNEIENGRNVFTINATVNDMIHPDFCILDTEAELGELSIFEA